MRLFSLIAVGLALLGGIFAQPRKPAAKAKPAPPKTAAKAPPRPAVRWQMQPAPQRSKEIQQALADKGYFQGEADGTWGPTSVDALKRFQADQHLNPDGKLSSLTLIGLGLGSEHGTIPPVLGPDGVHP